MEKISLGLGLYYSLTNKHIDYPNEWICRSNVPALEFKQLKVQTEDEAHIKVRKIIAENFSIMATLWHEYLFL